MFGEQSLNVPRMAGKNHVLAAGVLRISVAKPFMFFQHQSGESPKSLSLQDFAQFVDAEW